MTLTRMIVAVLLVAVSETHSPLTAGQPNQPSVSGSWKGYFYQVPGGLINPGKYLAEATFEQAKDEVTGEICIAMAAKPECFHKMTVKGKVGKTDVVFKDEKVVESKEVSGRWFTARTFTGKVSEFGSIEGTWVDPSEASGKGTFALVRMDYSIRIKRAPVDDEGLIPGKLHLNGVYLGDVYENPKYIIPAGEYKAKRRVTSEKGFVQGPGAIMGNKGDFLLEIAGVQKRSDILIHPGNKPEHSEGCILAGPVTKKSSTKIAPPLLTALRLHFFGTDKPANSTTEPVYSEKEKGIVIKIEDDNGKQREATEPMQKRKAIDKEK